MANVGKKYADSVKLLEKNKLYDPAEALALVCRRPRRSSMRLSRSTSAWVLTPSRRSAGPRCRGSAQRNR